MIDLRTLFRRLRLLAARGVLRLVEDAGGLQRVQLDLLAGETRDGIERMQQYGFTSHPLVGAEAFAIFLSGDRGRGVALAIDDRRYRLKSLAAGEVALYTDEGDVIHFKRGRTIEITAGAKVKVTAPTVEVIASSKVTVTTPLTEVSQNVTIGGTLQVTGQITGAGGMAISGGAGAQVNGNVTVSGGNVTADGIGLKTHVHGGVQTGGSNTTGPSG